MADAKSSPAWTLRCPWCRFRILVGGRGMRGNDPGAGVEAAGIMEAHAEQEHGCTWWEYLEASNRQAARARNRPLE